jgi:CTP:molybdopterin cytidylyltransferase MocA
VTVGAVVVPDDHEEAVSDAGGRVAVRRIVDVAWAGGAMPIVVVADDADGRVSAALGGSPARLVDPAGAGGVAAWRLGAEAALEAVLETSALLLWPGRMTWVDPETVTSLIEAHGRADGRVMRPASAGDAGWPVLLPRGAALELLAVEGPSLDVLVRGLEASSVEVGDPGSVHGREIGLDELPAYAGPPEPAGGPPPEWGAAAAERQEPVSPADDPPGPG